MSYKEIKLQYIYKYNKLNIILKQIMYILCKKYLIVHQKKIKIKISTYLTILTSLVAQMVKSPSAMQETLVQSLDWEIPLDKELATHSSILAWRISWKEEPGRL